MVNGNYLIFQYLFIPLSTLGSDIFNDKFS